MRDAGCTFSDCRGYGQVVLCQRRQNLLPRPFIHPATLSPLAPPTTPHLLYSIRHTVTFRVHVFPIVPIPISFRRFVHQFQIVFFPHFLQLFHFHPGTIGIVFTLLLSLLPGHMPHQTTTKTNTQ